MQSYVSGETLPPLPAQPTRSGYSTTQPQTDIHSGEYVELTVERSMSDHPELAEEVRQEDFTPTPTVEHRRFALPHSDWDPAR